MAPSMNGHTNGIADLSDETMVPLLIEDLLMRFNKLNNKHTSYVQDTELERELALSSRKREQSNLATIDQLQRILNRDPHILVLVDGDGMIFNSRFLRDGETGGKQAAAALHDAVHDWAMDNVIECPANTKVVVRIFANLKSLANICTKAGLVTSPNTVEEFARGFTSGKPLFDFIDIGSGKARTDLKMAENLKLYLYDYHCRQILLGCSHDISYAQVLEQYVGDVQVVSRLTLLEGTPFEKELAALPFRTKELDGIFRKTKLNVGGPVGFLNGLGTCKDSALNATCGVFTPRSETPYSQIYSPGSNAPLIDIAPLVLRASSHLRTDSINSSSSNDNCPSSWAAKAKSSAALPFTDLVRNNAAPSSPETVLEARSIRRNRRGQRLDTELTYDRDEVQRMKKLKCCNQHYIGNGCCHFLAGKADKCPHAHDLRLGKKDLFTLSVVARETPCKRGSDCDDLKCIYGHVCPFPVATEGTMRGFGCLNGETCRFPRDMHGMDKMPVKTLRITGAF